MTTPQTYVIRSTDEQDDDGSWLYWNNTDGWVDRASADVWDSTDGRLPLGGVWEASQATDGAR